jgi:hypothetical protein
VFLNGQKVGFNRGGYHKFTINVTNYTKYGQENEMCGHVSSLNSFGYTDFSTDSSLCMILRIVATMSSQLESRLYALLIYSIDLAVESGKVCGLSRLQ